MVDVTEAAMTQKQATLTMAVAAALALAGAPARAQGSHGGGHRGGGHSGGSYAVPRGGHPSGGGAAQARHPQAGTGGHYHSNYGGHYQSYSSAVQTVPSGLASGSRPARVGRARARYWRGRHLEPSRAKRYLI